MLYKFNAYGHPNIAGTHKTTLEFTKDKEVSLKGDCIIGVNADFELSKLKNFIKKSKNKKIEIRIEADSKKIVEKIKVEINSGFCSNHELVIRKTDFISERTFGIRSNKASFDLNRALIMFLKKKNGKIRVIFEKKE